MDFGFSAITETVSPSGERLLVDDEGNRIIAATRRPDGTLRKEIRIRKGYFRQEEQSRFISRGTEFKKRTEEIGNVPVGFLPVDISSTSTQTSSSNKSKKKKKPKKTETDLSDIPPPVIEIFAPKLVSESGVSKDTTVSAATTAEAIVVDSSNLEEQSKEAPNLNNRLRNVKKRLLEIEKLEQKRSEGKTLTAEQIKKLGRKKDVLKEIKELEANMKTESFSQEITQL